MNNRLTALFQKKDRRILNVYCTAGYPEKNSTPEVLTALQENGADIIEIGIPYSDPVADGAVIQQSNMQALKNGMTLDILFDQLKRMKDQVHVPLILMGYLNPVMQYGMERFCGDAAAAGISGIILPDLPMHEYKKYYKKIFDAHNLCFIFLITPQTTGKRIKQADKLSSGFLYVVSSTATTGAALHTGDQKAYFERISGMTLKNPLLIGFGISNKSSFDFACNYAAGAISGSAYIKALANGTSGITNATKTFISSLTTNHF